MNGPSAVPLAYAFMGFMLWFFREFMISAGASHYTVWIMGALTIFVGVLAVAGLIHKFLDRFLLPKPGRR